MTYPVDDPPQARKRDHLHHRFPDRERRGKIVPAHVIAPDEVPDSGYPMVLSTGRVLEHWHTGSMTRRSHGARSDRAEAVAFMSPKDHAAPERVARRFHPAESAARAVEIKVRSDATCLRTWCLCRSATRKPRRPCSPIRRWIPFGKIPEFKFCAVRPNAPDPHRAE